MKAYTKGITKEQFVAEVKQHMVADNFIKGTYQRYGKGCAVGCSIKSICKLTNQKLDLSQHLNYETYLGIPEWLAQLEDRLFEGVSFERSKLWPLQFSEAINEGADLEDIKIPFTVFILEHNIRIQEELLVTGVPANIKAVVQGAINANKQMVEAQLTRSARSAESAAWSAAESAARSAAWSAARSAESAAWSAESAAESARSAAWSAAESAARSAAESARSATYELYADKLTELLKECK